MSQIDNIGICFSQNKLKQSRHFVKSPICYISFDKSRSICDFITILPCHSRWRPSVQESGGDVQFEGIEEPKKD